MLILKKIIIILFNEVLLFNKSILIFHNVILFFKLIRRFKLTYIIDNLLNKKYFTIFSKTIILNFDT